MKSVFDACDPRDDVLKGELRDDIFAARLEDVIGDRGEEVYRKPEIFFENTFPTAGLKTLLNEALGRLTGNDKTANAVIRLETAFGGGKTHNLIGLYHLAKGRMPGSRVRTFVNPELVPTKPIENVCGIVGGKLDPSNGIDHGDCKTHTLWGELAYQIGGKAGYEVVEASDRERRAPGIQTLQKLVGDRPALIMIDELARHLRVCRRGEDSHLAGQTVAFLMALLEFASSRDRVVVTFTLADSKDAFAEETDEIRQELERRIQADISEAKKISARQERVITPTAETEISSIVTHRLFKRIDRDAASQTAKAYWDFLCKQGLSAETWGVDEKLT